MQKTMSIGRTMALATLFVAVVAALALACAAIAPGNAYAKGKKTEVWVVTKIAEKSPEGSYSQAMKYNKNGLLSVHSDTYASGRDKNTNVTSYKYKKNKLKSWTYKADGKVAGTAKVKLDKKGRPVSATYKAKKQKFTYKYTFGYNAKGQLVKYSNYLSSHKYAYDKAGRVVKDIDNNAESGLYRMTYAYDKAGNITKVAYNGSLERTVKNSYKNGRLVKQNETIADDGTKVTAVYTYKKVKVPKSYAKMVKMQQDALVRGILPVESAHK